MTVWMIRSGRHGEREPFDAERHIASIGWEELTNLSSIQTKQDLDEALQNAYPDKTKYQRANNISQLWAFIKEMKKGDWILRPSKINSVILIGKISGDYQYHPEFPVGFQHTRSVEWLKEIPRNQFDPDILYSLTAQSTICRIKRENIEHRIQILLSGTQIPSPLRQPEEEATSEDILDIEEYSLDLIRRFIEQKFKGHKLAHLVAAILEAEGFHCSVSPEGPDGGVDILAGYGLMGFDSPKLVVQVKSGNTPVDTKTVNELQGVMKSFNADRGLMVSWSGYKSSVNKLSTQHFFDLRLWDSNDLLEALFATYDKLPDNWQTEIPLKRIWIPVQPEE